MQKRSNVGFRSRAQDEALENRITDGIETHPNFWGVLIIVEAFRATPPEGDCAE